MTTELTCTNCVSKTQIINEMQTLINALESTPLHIEQLEKLSNTLVRVKDVFDKVRYDKAHDLDIDMAYNTNHNIKDNLFTLQVEITFKMRHIMNYINNINATSDK